MNHWLVGVIAYGGLAIACLSMQQRRRKLKANQAPGGIATVQQLLAAELQRIDDLPEWAQDHAFTAAVFPVLFAASRREEPFAIELLTAIKHTATVGEAICRVREFVEKWS